MHERSCGSIAHRPRASYDRPRTSNQKAPSKIHCTSLTLNLANGGVTCRKSDQISVNMERLDFTDLQ